MSGQMDQSSVSLPAARLDRPGMASTQEQPRDKTSNNNTLNTTVDSGAVPQQFHTVNVNVNGVVKRLLVPINSAPEDDPLVLMGLIPRYLAKKTGCEGDTIEEPVNASDQCNSPAPDLGVGSRPETNISPRSGSDTDSSPETPICPDADPISSRPDTGDAPEDGGTDKLPTSPEISGTNTSNAATGINETCTGTAGPPFFRKKTASILPSESTFILRQHPQMSGQNVTLVIRKAAVGDAMDSPPTSQTPNIPMSQGSPAYVRTKLTSKAQATTWRSILPAPDKNDPLSSLPPGVQKRVVQGLTIQTADGKMYKVQPSASERSAGQRAIAFTVNKPPDRAPTAATRPSLLAAALHGSEAGFSQEDSPENDGSSLKIDSVYSMSDSMHNASTNAKETSRSAHAVIVSEKTKATDQDSPVSRATFTCSPSVDKLSSGKQDNTEEDLSALKVAGQRNKQHLDIVKIKQEPVDDPNTLDSEELVAMHNNKCVNAVILDKPILGNHEADQNLPNGHGRAAGAPSARKRSRGKQVNAENLSGLKVKLRMVGQDNKGLESVRVKEEPADSFSPNAVDTNEGVTGSLQDGTTETTCKWPSVTPDRECVGCLIAQGRYKRGTKGSATAQMPASPNPWVKVKSETAPAGAAGEATPLKLKQCYVVMQRLNLGRRESIKVKNVQRYYRAMRSCGGRQNIPGMTLTLPLKRQPPGPYPMQWRPPPSRRLQQPDPPPSTKKKYFLVSFKSASFLVPITPETKYLAKMAKTDGGASDSRYIETLLKLKTHVQFHNSATEPATDEVNNDRQSYAPIMQSILKSEPRTTSDFDKLPVDVVAKSIASRTMAFQGSPATNSPCDSQEEEPVIYAKVEPAPTAHQNESTDVPIIAGCEESTGQTGGKTKTKKASATSKKRRLENTINKKNARQEEEEEEEPKAVEKTSPVTTITHEERVKRLKTRLAAQKAALERVRHQREESRRILNSFDEP